MEKLVSQIKEEGYLDNPRIEKAFLEVDRADFVPDEIEEDYANRPLPIGEGQTISQPLTVAFMLELLEPEEGDKVLDIGSGSGWQAALLAELVGREGQVFSVEIIEELKEFAETNASKCGFENLEFIVGDGKDGLEEEAPFDRIIAAASAQEIPKALLEQLKVGGILVMPVGHSLVRVKRVSEEEFEETDFPGFSFVPFV